MELQGPWYRIPTTSMYIVEGKPDYIRQIDRYNGVFKETKLWVCETEKIFHKVKVADPSVEKVDKLLFNKSTEQVFIEKGNVPETVRVCRKKYVKMSTVFNTNKIYPKKMILKADPNSIVQRLEHKQVAALEFIDYNLKIRQIIEHPEEKCIPYADIRTVRFEVLDGDKVILSGMVKECVDYVFDRIKL